MSIIRSKRGRILLIATAIVLIALAVLIPRLLDLDRYRPLITRELEQALGADVVVGDLSWGISNGVWVEMDGLRVTDSTEIPLDLDLATVFAKVAVMPLLSKKVVVKQVSLDSPSITLRLAPAEGEPAEAPPPEAVDAGPMLPVKVEIREISLTKGVLTVRDSITGDDTERVTTVEDIAIEISNLAPGRTVAFRFALQDTTSPGLGRLEGKGSFSGLTESLSLDSPRLSIDATLRDFDTGILRLYADEGSALDSLNGPVSMDLKYEGDLGRHLRAEGQLDLSGISYTDPSLWEQPLPGQATTLGYTLELDPSRIELKAFDLRLGELSLDGHAAVRDWSNDKASLESGSLRGELPLETLMPLVPWGSLEPQDADLLRSLLSGGGAVRIEELVIPEFAFKDLSAKRHALLRGLKASLNLTDLSFKAAGDWPAVEDVSGQLILEQGVLSAERITSRFRALRLPTLTARVTELFDQPRVSVSAQGPLKLAAVEGSHAQDLLGRYGLRNVEVKADVDIEAIYDTKSPERWKVDGELHFNGMTAESDPEGVRLDDLRGLIAIKRREHLDVQAEGLSARINNSPIGLDGSLRHAPDGALSVATKIKAQKLDLGQLAALIPELKQRRLAGLLDTDLDIRYEAQNPDANRLHGWIRTKGLGIHAPGPGIQLTDGNIDIALAGQTVEVKSMRLLLNEQQIDVSGRLSNPHAPIGSLRLSSPSLNVDRLLAGVRRDAAGEDEEPALVPSAADAAIAPPAQLPPRARAATLDLEVEVSEGEYRKESFRDLKIDLDYERGLLKRADLAVGVGDGQLAVRGMVDLRNLQGIDFRMATDVQAVPLESLVPLLGSEMEFMHGPLTLNGEVRGTMGSTDDLMRSLDGGLDLDIGPGRMHVNSVAGKFVLRALSAIQLRGGVLRRDQDVSEASGIPYDSLTVRTKLQGGQMDVATLQLVTPAIRADSSGTVDLVAQTLDMDADVALLGSVDAVLGRVPVVGGAATDLTSVHLDIDGSLAEPAIRVRPLRGVTRGLGNLLRGVGRGVGSVFQGEAEADQEPP